MPPKGHSSSSHSSRSSHSSSRSSSRSSSSRSSSSRSSGHRSSSYSSGPSRHSSTSRSSRPLSSGSPGRSATSRSSVPRRPRQNQPTGFHGTGRSAPIYYYGRHHDYVFFPAAWTDTATGTSYESGYYDENGQYYPNVSFSKNGRYENVVCHCPYCGQDTLMNPSADEVTARNLHCPNCGAPMEIRSELDEYRGPSAYSSAVSAAPRRKRRWIIPLVIVLVLAGLYALGSRELKKEAETQPETFQITEPANDPDTDLFGQTIRLASSGDRSYTISDTSGDKTLVWDPDVESYYDESSDCWIWYNTDVEPAVWQYWYEGISSDFGDYGWMEHDADEWFIEESYGNWISLPETYDTGRLWFIEE